MLHPKKILRLLAVTQVLAYSASTFALDCGPGNSGSSSSQGCCVYGPTCECEPEEHSFVTYGARSFQVHDPCNPENDYVEWEPYGPDENFVQVNPNEMECGVNSSSFSVNYFATTGPDNCHQCGYISISSYQNQDCG